MLSLVVLDRMDRISAICRKSVEKKSYRELSGNDRNPVHPAPTCG
jgi:hypothetical protein